MYKNKTIGIGIFLYQEEHHLKDTFIKILEQRKYNIITFLACHDKHHRFPNIPLLSIETIKKYKIDCIVDYFPYSPAVRKPQQEANIPMLYINKQGALPQSCKIDASGLFSDSHLYKIIKEEIDLCLTPSHKKWFDTYSKYLIQNNISKISQPSITDKVKQPFIFLPMQSPQDDSITALHEIDYNEFVQRVAKFCYKNNITLAIKKHPKFEEDSPLMRQHKYQQIKKESHQIINNATKRYECVKVVNGSMHKLCQNSLCMVGANTSSVIDAFINKKMAFNCGNSAYTNSGAIIHDNNIEKGITKCLNIKDNEKQEMLNRQAGCIYFLYNKYFPLYTDIHNSELNNKQKITNQIEVLEKQFTSN